MKYQELRTRKQELSNKICVLRKRLKLRASYKPGDSLPEHILKDNWFVRYERFVKESQEIDLQIQKIPKHERDRHSFPALFLLATKEKYPKIYNDIVGQLEER